MEIEQVIRKHGISQKSMQSALDCINRLAATYKTQVAQVEVIDKYNQDGLATWQIMYTFTNGNFYTLMVNRKAIY